MAKYNFSLRIVALLLCALQWGTAGARVIKVFRTKETTLESPENAGLGLEVATHQVHRRDTTTSRNLDSCLKHLEFLSDILEAHSEYLENPILIENFFEPNILGHGFVAKTDVTGKQSVILHFTGEEVTLFSCLSNVAKLQAAAEELDADVDALVLRGLTQQTVLKMFALRVITADESQTKTDTLTTNSKGENVVNLDGNLGSDVVSMVENVISTAEGLVEYADKTTAGLIEDVNVVLDKVVEFDDGNTCC